MYILDTDHLSLIRRNGAEGKRILAKLSTVANSDVATTIVTYEEQTRGRFAVLGQAKTLDEVVRAYNGLQQLVLDYQSIVIIAFDYNAALEHQRLRKQYPRLGNMDLKIAAIALTQQATLLTRNLADFAQIAKLLIENWADP
ncbi:virulence-associated protein VapC homolog [Fischerella sp. NIES-4106]|nr:virulence-associated protein VapC homolog [Fischerella sp. NIES-4106]